MDEDSTILDMAEIDDNHSNNNHDNGDDNNHIHNNNNDHNHNNNNNDPNRNNNNNNTDHNHNNNNNNNNDHNHNNNNNNNNNTYFVPKTWNQYNTKHIYNQATPKRLNLSPFLQNKKRKTHHVCYYFMFSLYYKDFLLFYFFFVLQTFFFLMLLYNTQPSPIYHEFIESALKVKQESSIYVKDLFHYDQFLFVPRTFLLALQSGEKPFISFFKHENAAPGAIKCEPHNAVGLYLKKLQNKEQYQKDCMRIFKDRYLKGIYKFLIQFLTGSHHLKNSRNEKFWTVLTKTEGDKITFKKYSEIGEDQNDAKKKLIELWSDPAVEGLVGVVKSIDIHSADDSSVVTVCDLDSELEKQFNANQNKAQVESVMLLDDNSMYIHSWKEKNIVNLPEWIEPEEKHNFINIVNVAPTSAYIDAPTLKASDTVISSEHYDIILTSYIEDGLNAQIWNLHYKNAHELDRSLNAYRALFGGKTIMNWMQQKEYNIHYGVRMHKGIKDFQVFTKHHKKTHEIFNQHLNITDFYNKTELQDLNIVHVDNEEVEDIDISMFDDETIEDESESRIQSPQSTTIPTENKNTSRLKEEMDCSDDDDASDQHEKEDNDNDSVFARCKMMLQAIKNKAYSKPFEDAFDWKQMNEPNYPNVIKNPMDLSIVQQKLDNDQYETLHHFGKEARLIYQNATSFHNPGTPYYIAANKLAKKFEKEFKTVIDSFEVNDFTKRIAAVLLILIEQDIAAPFRMPANSNRTEFCDYYDIIKSPMDLGTIMNRIDSYTTFDKFATDLTLVFKNWCQYKPKDNFIHQQASKLLENAKTELDRFFPKV